MHPHEDARHPGVAGRGGVARRGDHSRGRHHRARGVRRRRDHRDRCAVDVLTLGDRICRDRRRHAPARRARRQEPQGFRRQARSRGRSHRRGAIAGRFAAADEHPDERSYGPADPAEMDRSGEPKPSRLDFVGGAVAGQRGAVGRAGRQHRGRSRAARELLVAQRHRPRAGDLRGGSSAHQVEPPAPGGRQ